MTTPRPEPDWSDADVEIAAQCSMEGIAPPQEMILRLGLTPPRDFLEAFGDRVTELSLRALRPPARLPEILKCAICSNMVDRDGDCIAECEHTAQVQSAYRAGKFG